MNERQTSAPYSYGTSEPPRHTSPYLSARKLLFLGGLVMVLMLGALIVFGLIKDRESSSRRVTEEITSQWGGAITLRTPYIATSDTLDQAIISPTGFNCDIDVKSKSLHRGIYEASVFSATVNMTGAITLDAVSQANTPDTVLFVLPAYFVKEIKPLELATETYQWKKDGRFYYASVPSKKLALDDSVHYDIRFTVSGSYKLGVIPSAAYNRIVISGDARNPSFSKDNLPFDRMVTDNEFRAEWIETNQAYAPSEESCASVSFLVGVDTYQKVSRAIKYAFIIIVLTFLSVFYTEIRLRQPIPLFNYFLIGVALILFYSLLLSMSELISFHISYLTAALMTITLITLYMWRMVKSGRTAGTICGILTIIYGVCYILLSLSTYALLTGSLLLFIALAITMFLSLQDKN